MMFADKNANGIVETPGRSPRKITITSRCSRDRLFGLGYEGPWLMNDAVARDNKYQYNGKEWNDGWGLKWNDYGARWYMADVGRWGAVDLLAAKFPNWSPYNFVLNNPMGNIDPDGQDVILLINSKAPFGTHMGGHSAVLIGDDSHGWVLYEKTGDNNADGEWQN